MSARRRREFLRLLDAASSAPGLIPLALALVEPLSEYDRLHDGDLVRTVRTYFSLGMNATKTAETLFLHRNGLLYRLARVEELLGISLADREVTLAIELALRAMAMTDEESGR